MTLEQQRRLNEEKARELRRERNLRYYNKHHRLDARTEDKRLIRVRLPEQLLAVIERMITETSRSGKYAYQSMPEAMADLIRRGIGTWRHGHNATEQAWPALEVLRLLDDVAKQRRQIQSMTRRLREEINELHAAKADREAIQYYHSVMDAIGKMPPTAHRDAAIKTLQKEFPLLAKAVVPGMQLVPLKKT